MPQFYDFHIDVHPQARRLRERVMHFRCVYDDINRLRSPSSAEILLKFMTNQSVMWSA
jgi:hypothetical protein